MIIVRSSHVAANGIIPFFFMAEEYSIVSVYIYLSIYLSLSLSLSIYIYLYIYTPLWCVGLFLLSLFCSIDPYVYFLPIPCCLDYCSFVVLSEVWEGYASSFVLFPQHWFYGLLWFYINFRIICSSSVKYVMGNLKGITLNL